MRSANTSGKKCAKQLKNILETSGLAYPLVKCQSAVARAGGYRDWRDLTRRISQRANTNLPYDYWGGLIRSLPEPCHLPVKSYLRNDRTSEPADEAIPKCWLRYTLLYLLSMEVVHRISTGPLRPGSGKDQKLRPYIVHADANAVQD